MAQEDTLLAGKAAGREIGELQVVRLARGRRSLDLWNALCLPRSGPDAPVLLLPDEYELIDPIRAPDVLAELLQVPPCPCKQILHVWSGTRSAMDSLIAESYTAWASQ